MKMNDMLMKAILVCLADDVRPLNDMSATEVIADMGNCANFARALELSGVGDMLDKKGPHTVFAPSDDAFNMKALGLMQGVAGLAELLRCHIVPGKYLFTDIQRSQVLRSVAGYPLTVGFEDGITINGAEITRPDVPYDKGVIHVVDGILVR